ncbi:MAG: BLUF domain-containing protein [Oleiphilaceae bacterium]|nr:BLUF domain-containing protein [Oleiphilaceae bacterium]
MNEPLIQLAYVSQATAPLDDVQLLEILNISRKNNEQDAITGFLMHCDGNFFQVIEGPSETINPLYDRLLKDVRHHQVTKVMLRNIEQRIFGKWSMAFRSIAIKESEAIPGFSDFLNGYLAGMSDVPGAHPEFIESDVLGIIRSLRERFLG